MKSWRYFRRGKASLLMLNVYPCGWLGTTMIQTTMIRMGDVKVNFEQSNEAGMMVLAG